MKWNSYAQASKRHGSTEVEPRIKLRTTTTINQGVLQYIYMTKIDKPRTTKPLTRKQQAFVQHLVNNPKDSATTAVKATYGTTDKPVTYLTARNIAHTNLTKPNIQTELSKYSNMVEDSIITTINRYKDSEQLEEVKEAMQNARWVHDKVHGKATQKVETTSKVLSISIDLTSEDIEQ